MTATILKSGTSFAITFRRTDADRRPARVVRQPNDGPAPDRYERAASILASLETRRSSLPRPAERKEMVLRALAAGSKNNRDLAAALGVTASVVSGVLRQCEQEGLVVRTVNRLSIGQEVISSLTPAGCAEVLDLAEAA